MAWRFNKRVKLAPGITLNIGKRGVSASVGPRGAKTTVGTTGRHHTTVGLPGTGLSATHVHKRARRDCPGQTQEASRASALVVAVAVVGALAAVIWLAR